MNRVSRCLHCDSERYIRGRGLCNPCYDDPEICGEYALIDNRGIGNWNAPSKVPDVPTDHLPGSEGKIAVMTQRVQEGCSAFHPKDDCSRFAPENPNGRPAGHKTDASRKNLNSTRVLWLTGRQRRTTVREDFGG